MFSLVVHLCTFANGVINMKEGIRCGDRERLATLEKADETRSRLSGDEPSPLSNPNVFQSPSAVAKPSTNT